MQKKGQISKMTKKVLIIEKPTAGGYNIIVEVGKKYKDFRGEEWILDGFETPTHEGSTGRVYVHKPGKDEIETAREFFPGVLGMKFVDTFK